KKVPPGTDLYLVKAEHGKATLQSRDGQISVTVSVKTLARENSALLMPTADTAAAPPLRSGGVVRDPPAGDAAQASVRYAREGRLDHATAIPDGFVDVGNKGGREILRIDPARDPALKAMVEQVQALRSLPEEQRAAALNQYVHDVMNGGAEHQGVVGRVMGWE